MAGEALLKTKSTLDNRDFNKGVQQMKQEMKDLNKVSSDAFASIGSAIGLDTRQIQQFSSALSGLGKKLTQTGSDGTAAFSKISNAVISVGAGIAGLGLAAAIAAFKQLNAEADAFESTIQGGLIKAQTDAYISTYQQAIRDQRGVGENASNWRSSWREFWATWAANLKTGNNLEMAAEATQAANRAKELAGEIYNIDLKRKENAVQISQIDAQIAEQREIISDATRSASERAAALADAQQLIKDKLDLQLPLEERRRDLIVELNGLASDTMKDFEAEIAAKISVNNLIQQESAEQRTLLRQQKQINAELEKERELRDAMAASRGQLKEWGEMAGSVTPMSAEATVQVPATLVITNRDQAVRDIIDLSKELESVMIATFDGIGESLGVLIGNLATGGDAWGSFSNAALSAFGDMAVSVGKMAIATGTATLGIKAALESLNGWVAIAAGVALVALGSAVKAGLSNVANGNYGAGVNVASSGSYSSGSAYETRDVNIHISGQLRADGDQLVAVINNTTNRNGYTT